MGAPGQARGAFPPEARHVGSSRPARGQGPDQAFRRAGCKRRHFADRRRRRIALPSGREWRRKVDAVLLSLRPSAAGRRRGPGRRQGPDPDQPRRCHRRGHRHGTSAFRAGSGVLGSGKHHGRDGQRLACRPAGRPGPHRGHLQGIRPDAGPRPPGRGAFGGRKAMGRDREGAIPRRAASDPG